MVIVTGGAFQGKTAFAESLIHRSEIRRADGADASWEELCAADLITNLHLWIAELLKKGEDPKERAILLIQKNPNAVITVNELGCGIVPVEAFDRQWRETTGRVCCELAGKADAVYRVICGIGTKMK